MAETGVLIACDGRRDDKGDPENAEREGSLMKSSLESLLTAQIGVDGEAIDLEVAGLVDMSTVLGEGRKVDKEERDSGFDEIEPC
jgi:hypothetical protein